MAESLTSPEERILETLDRLRSLRDENSGEIPDEIVHTGRFKVRGGWFYAVAGNVQLLLRFAPPRCTPVV